MPINSLAQNNGTLDTFYKYKKRVIPAKQICQLPNALCPPSKLCKPGYQVIKKIHGMFCCPKVMPLFAGPGIYGKLCTKIGFEPPYDITPKPHPQTHDGDTYRRERRRQRQTRGEARHQNRVAEPEEGSPIMSYLVLGGAGFLGYKMYKSWKAKKAAR